MELFGRRYDTGQPVRVETSGSRVARVEPLDSESLRDGRTDGWPWLAPGLFDIQVNGYGGQEFSSAVLTEEKVGSILRAFEAFGVTRVLPTVTTEGHEVLKHALRTIASVCEGSPQWSRRIPGIHLEGPFITAEDGARGAHPKQHCHPPDWVEFQRLQEAAGGRICILTLSPEYDGSTAFLERVASTGVTVAIGHTSARPEQVHAAVDAGARLSTHLGNGSHPTLHRFRNYLWPQMADDRLAAGIIVDGHHLPADLVKVIVRAKTPERCILVSDLSGQAGQAPGTYTSPFSNVEILPDGRLVVAGQRELLGGASLPLSVGVANVMRFAGVDLKKAVEMATLHPARLLGLNVDTLEPGQPANLIQFDLAPEATDSPSEGLRVRATVVDGETVWGTPWRPD